MIESIITNYSKYILYYLIFINLITGLIFLYDKIKSNIVDADRVDESTFHTLGFFGGIFSTFTLVILLNHKSTKMTFQFITYLILSVWIYIGFKFYKYVSF